MFQKALNYHCIVNVRFTIFIHNVVSLKKSDHVLYQKREMNFISENTNFEKQIWNLFLGGSL